MKILELSDYSAGICGVFARVKQEAALLAERGHEVAIFSSNFIKGSRETAGPEDSIGKVKIKRFKASYLGGESFLKWDFEKDALDFKPDAIIAHSYRHLHTTKALKIARKIGCKVFLVTHAPFDRNDSRSFFARHAVSFYDSFIGPGSLKKFDKVITITKWEREYLEKMNVPSDKVEYIPNGLAKEFFEKIPKKTANKLLYLGRVSPIKNIESVINTMHLLEDKKIIFEIVGPAEEEYLEKLKEIIKEKSLENRVVFTPAIFDTCEKIKKIDSALFFILPSKSEGMPQSLIEAMARKRIVIASNNKGAKDLIEDRKSGFLFKVSDVEDCAKAINEALNLKAKEKEKMSKNAQASVSEFAWDKIIDRIEALLK